MGRTNSQSKITIIVSSCDKYSDLWKPFFDLFHIFWKKCPFPIILIANKKIFHHPQVNFKTVNTGQDQGWATNILKVLKKINTPYILYLQEDYLLAKKVNEKKIINCIKFLQKKDGACLRLIPCPKPQLNYKDSKTFGIIDKTKPFSVSLQGTIWHKKTFEKIIIQGESGWDMESLGSKRAISVKKEFYSLKTKKLPLKYFFIEPIEIHFYTAVNYGFWLKETKCFLKKHNIAADYSQRETCSIKDIEEKRKWFSDKKIISSSWWFITRIRIPLVSLLHKLFAS